MSLEIIPAPPMEVLLDAAALTMEYVSSSPEVYEQFIDWIFASSPDCTNPEEEKAELLDDKHIQSFAKHAELLRAIADGRAISLGIRHETQEKS